MRHFKLFLLAAAVMITESGRAQNAGHLRLSDLYPTAGEKVRFTYKPIGTPLEDEKGIEASVYDMDYVDLWENGDYYADALKKFMDDHGYAFHVLLDERIAAPGKTKAGNAYEVNAIPIKFVVDKYGHLRFRSLGYAGSPGKVLDEISEMIEMTRNSVKRNTGSN
jgi:hypothetical protein